MRPRTQARAQAVGWCRWLPLTLLLSADAFAARGTEVAVVGAHVDGQDDETALAGAASLSAALNDAGKVDVVEPGEVRGRIVGREILIVEGAFLAPGRARLEEGRVLFERADFEGAVDVLDVAVTRLEEAVPGTPDLQDLIDALIVSGAARASVGDAAGALAVFTRVVELDPSRQLDAVNYPPKLVRVFDQARADVLGRADGKLTVRAPDGARVFVDGREESGAVRLPPGLHHVHVIGAKGARQYAAIELDAGGSETWTATLDARSLAEPAATEAERSDQIARFYTSLGVHLDADLILIAGETEGARVALQLYEPHTGSFSKVVSAEAGADPVDAMGELMPVLVGYISDQGALRADRVTHQIVPMDIGDNALLSSILLDPEPIVETVTVTKGPPWYLWAGVAAIAAGGAATLAVVLTDEDPVVGDGGGDDGGDGGAEEDPNQGVIVVGPLP